MEEVKMDKYYLSQTTSKKISNVLTKRGAARNQLTTILDTGKLPSLS